MQLKLHSYTLKLKKKKIYFRAPVQTQHERPCTHVFSDEVHINEHWYKY